MKINKLSKEKMDKQYREFIEYLENKSDLTEYDLKRFGADKEFYRLKRQGRNLTNFMFYKRVKHFEAYNKYKADRWALDKFMQDLQKRGLARKEIIVSIFYNKGLRELTDGIILVAMHDNDYQEFVDDIASEIKTKNLDKYNKRHNEFLDTLRILKLDYHIEDTEALLYFTQNKVIYDKYIKNKFIGDLEELVSLIKIKRFRIGNRYKLSDFKDITERSITLINTQDYDKHTEREYKSKTFELVSIENSDIDFKENIFILKNMNISSKFNQASWYEMIG